MLKKIICLVFAILMICIPINTFALDNNSYTYNEQKEAVSVTSPYSVSDMVGLGLGLKEAKDMRISGDYIYILDSGNHRVVVINKNYEFVKNIYITKNGEPYNTDELTGLWVDGQTILITDKRSECIYRINMDGELLNVYKSPEDNVTDSTVVFMPKRILTDKTGLMYILLENEYRGLMVMDPDGKFVTYYGSVQVSVTGELLSDMFWRNFLTEEQIQGSAQYVPGSYNDLTTDGSGFIYAIKGVSSSNSELICKLNPEGKNVLPYKGDFGNHKKVDNKNTTFTTLAVDKQGFIAALDSITNRIFEYSPDGELLYVFGNEGELEGSFITPSAMIYNDDELVVLDSQTNCITVFSRNKFANNVHSAVVLYRDAKFEEAGEYWEQVLAQDGSYELALVGLGKIAEVNKDYVTAMDYYRAGSSKEDYSSAFFKYRTELGRKYFSVVAILLVALVIGLSVYKRLKKTPKDVVKVSLEHRGKIAYTFFSVFHPFDGFGEMRYNKKGSAIIASIILALFFFAKCLNYNYNGYMFNSDNPEDFNVFIVLGSTIGVVFLFCLCTWLLGTFLEGKGTFKQIWIGVNYSLIPMIVGLFAELIFTNVLSLREAFFIGVLRTICTGYTLFLIFISTSKINQHNFSKNFVSVLFTIVGMLAIVFLVILFFNLGVQVIDFVKSVFTELNYRYMAL